MFGESTGKNKNKVIRGQQTTIGTNHMPRFNNKNIQKLQEYSKKYLLHSQNLYEPKDVFTFVNISELQVGNIYLNNHEHRQDYEYDPSTMIYLGPELAVVEDLWDHTIVREEVVYTFYEVESGFTYREQADEEGNIVFLPRINMGNV